MALVSSPTVPKQEAHTPEVEQVRALLKVADDKQHPLCWALRISSGVSEGVYKSVVQVDGEFLHVGVAGGPGKTLGRQP